MTTIVTLLALVRAFVVALFIAADTGRRCVGTMFARYREALSAAGLVPRVVSTVGGLVVP
jgi:hypothetical protein